MAVLAHWVVRWGSYYSQCKQVSLALPKKQITVCYDRLDLLYCYEGRSYNIGVPEFELAFFW